MLRRRFLALLGLAPVVAVAAPLLKHLPAPTVGEVADYTTFSLPPEMPHIVYYDKQALETLKHNLYLDDVVREFGFRAAKQINLMVVEAHALVS